MDKTAQQYKKALRELTETVQAFENAMDAEMKRPADPERGKRIANLLNQLTLANQRAMHFTLGYSFEQINKLTNSHAPSAATASAPAVVPSAVSDKLDRLGYTRVLAEPPVGAVAEPDWALTLPPRIAPVIPLDQRHDASDYPVCIKCGRLVEEGITLASVPKRYHRIYECKFCGYVDIDPEFLAYDENTGQYTMSPASHPTPAAPEPKRTLEQRLTSGKAEDRTIERGELQDAIALVASGAVQPIEGHDYQVVPEPKRVAAKLSKADVTALTMMSSGLALRETVYGYWYIGKRKVTNNTALRLIENCLVTAESTMRFQRRYGINDEGRAALAR